MRRAPAPRLRSPPARRRGVARPPTRPAAVSVQPPVPPKSTRVTQPNASKSSSSSSDSERSRPNRSATSASSAIPFSRTACRAAAPGWIGVPWWRPWQQSRKGVATDGGRGRPRRAGPPVEPVTVRALRWAGAVPGASPEAALLRGRQRAGHRRQGAPHLGLSRLARRAPSAVSRTSTARPSVRFGARWSRFRRSARSTRPESVDRSRPRWSASVDMRTRRSRRIARTRSWVKERSCSARGGSTRPSSRTPPAPRRRPAHPAQSRLDSSCSGS